MNPVRKRPAYLFAKDFQIENVLGNLQGYKIATGQIDKSEVDKVSDRYGTDEGVVFGSLITKASESEKRQREEETLPQQNSKRKRKRRKRKRKNIESETDNSTVGICQVSEPLSIPSSILDYGSSGEEADTKSNNSNGQSDQETNSNSSSESDLNDFFSLGKTDKGSKDLLKTNAEVTSSQSTFQENDTLCHSYPEVRTDLDEWDEEKIKYKEKANTLSTYKCWKCKRIGHMAEDCTVQCSTSTSSSCTTQKPQTSSVLREYFKRCHAFRNRKNVKCSECSTKSNLVSCLDCGMIFCDGRGHLIDHLMSFPSHNKLYSFKLSRMIKCCKPTCEVVDSSQLLMCSTCLSKQFNSHYNMINATWSRSGLKGIPNTLACDQHFQWGVRHKSRAELRYPE